MTVCDTCGLEKIGGHCYTRWCADRHSSVDEVFGDPEVRTDGGQSTTETYQINGEQIPVEQVDEFDGDRILSTDVTRAVNEGFDFTDIWRHASVEVENGGETFTSTVVACEIEHGMAAIRLTDIGESKIKVAGHEVYANQKSVLPCPVCESSREVYYLGSRNSLTAGDEPRSYAVSGWVCPECESTLEVTDEDLRNGTGNVAWADVIVRLRQPGTDREPRDGESRDGKGGIRPVPQGVENPEVDR